MTNYSLGNCLFRSLSDQLFSTQEDHYMIRLLLLRFYIFSKYLMDVNEKHFKDHLRKIICPYTWGTHIEILAAASLFQIQLYYIALDETEHYRYEVVHPCAKIHCVTQRLLKPLLLTHFEIIHQYGNHYNSIMATNTRKPHLTFPHIPTRIVNDIHLDNT